jgi:hypothetical protein
MHLLNTCKALSIGEVAPASSATAEVIGPVPKSNAIFAPFTLLYLP